MTLGGLVAAMGNRSHGLLLLLFALPNLLPVAFPGMTTLFGAPIAMFATQLALGRRPWIPAWLAGRSVPRERLARLADHALPRLDRAERLLRPRWKGLTGPLGERVIGGVCAVLGTVIALPVPLGNILPALAVTILALALLERDGVAAAAGFAVALASIAVIFIVVAAIVGAFIFFLDRAFA